MKKKIVIADKVSKHCSDTFKSLGDYEIVELTDRAEIIKACENAHGLIVRSETKVDEEMISKFSSMEIIGRAGAGVDNINVKAASKKGIIVMNTPGGNTISAAEHTFAMIMALSRNIPQAYALLKEGAWERKKFTGVELDSKTLGVIGLGNIGKVLAGYAKAFNMRILGYDPFITDEIAARHHIELCEPKKIFQESDYISFHVPLNKDTQYFLNKDTIALCKKGVRIINCSRGGVINEQDLLEALNSGKIAGAAVDVFEKEPPAKDYPILKHPNFISTPHLGASTEEAQVNVALQIAKQMHEAFSLGMAAGAVNIPTVDPKLKEQMKPYLKLAGKLGSFIAQVSRGPITNLDIKYHGEITALPIKPITAVVLKGLLSHAMEENVNYVSAPFIAQERGIIVNEHTTNAEEEFSNQITISYKLKDEQHEVSGTVFGKSNLRIIGFDGFRFDAIPEGQILVYKNEDRPGMIGKIGTYMASLSINIGAMFLARKGSTAMTMMNIDQALTEQQLAGISGIPGFFSVTQVSF